MNRKELVLKYFREGYSYKSIVRFLEEVHGIFISVSTLKRILRTLGLRRRTQVTSTHIQQVLTLVKVCVLQNEVRGSIQPFRFRFRVMIYILYT